MNETALKNAVHAAIRGAGEQGLSLHEATPSWASYSRVQSVLYELLIEGKVRQSSAHPRRIIATVSEGAKGSATLRGSAFLHGIGYVCEYDAPSGMRVTPEAWTKHVEALLTFPGCRSPDGPLYFCEMRHDGSPSVVLVLRASLVAGRKAPRQIYPYQREPVFDMWAFVRMSREVRGPSKEAFDFFFDKAIRQPPALVFAVRDEQP